ncbi:PTH2-domain-containing protein [Pholiota conissans]|uniref:peptidyl-tRNA hydrolase n=1 Tax=Pholiota conissans TaxID=109636 RepID=A0A9P6CV94_9AGAR|nr:PTH2-domain-containing protein [Pholiota conissans]
MDQNNAALYGALITVASLSLGFWAGAKAANPVSTPVSEQPPPTAVYSSPTKSQGVSDINGNESDVSDDSSSMGDGDIASLRVDATDNCKMVLVVRTDLGMTSGKIAAQCSHAALACYKTLRAKNPTMLRQWERDGNTKVALRCEGEEELLLMQAQAQSLNLCARSIQDAGRTQIAAGSRTVLGIAGPARLVNQITGKLRLL